MNFHLESWNAVAPGVETRQDWEQWLRHPRAFDEPMGKMNLSSIPAMLRRRFNLLGKCAMGAALPLVEGIEAIPSIFASRHGDTEQSFSLLRDIGLGEPMSPTSFSLAVHNAVSGLFTIARKDHSEVTAIAAMDGLALQTLFEALGQLQERERVLCVIYDVPLPDFYHQHTDADDLSIPYAIAMIVSQASGERFLLQPSDALAPSGTGPGDTEAMRLLGVLTGVADETLLQQNGAIWKLTRADV